MPDVVTLSSADTPQLFEHGTPAFWRNPFGLTWVTTPEHPAPDIGATRVVPDPLKVAVPRLAATVRGITLTRGTRTEYLIAPITARRMYRTRWVYRKFAVQWWTFDLERRLAFLWVAERVAPAQVMVTG